MIKAILYIIGIIAIVAGIDYTHDRLFPNNEVSNGVMYLGIFFIVYLISFIFHLIKEFKKIREGFPNHYYSSSTEQEEDRNLGWPRRILFLMIKAVVVPAFIIAVLWGVKSYGH